MKNLMMAVLLIAVCLSGYALASSVTTADGVTFTVTNDKGESADYTMDQIDQLVDQSNHAEEQDRRVLLTDSETSYTWQGVKQMALNAQAQSNHSN